jgi:predicted esterase
MRLFSILIALLASLSAALAEEPNPEASQTAVAGLTHWLEGNRTARTPLEKAPFAAVALTKDDAKRAAHALWEDHLAELRQTRADELQAKVIRLGEREMKFEIVPFGKKEDAPPGGRSLFISMHGGGNGPAQLNDSQWQNQIKLSKAYAPAEGLYVAPRAPTNTWNLWHEAHIDPMFDRLIEDLVALENVNPNRVYILGYSAGGDGVYQLAPRMADRWAAASMMAGHPNETQPLGLRNVPFALQVGEKDNGYNRNKIAVEWGQKLDALQKEDPQGYQHFTELHAGKPHWMDLEDRKAIPWMEKFTRNPVPKRVCWRQDDVTHSSFYWLAIPKNAAKAGQEIIASVDGQVFEVSAKDIPTVTIRLNDALANLDEPLTIRSSGKVLFQGRVKRTVAVLAQTLAERGDRDLMFSAEVTVTP